MAPRKKPVRKSGKKKNLKFKTKSFIDTFIASVSETLNRAGKMIAGKVKRVFASLGSAVKSISRKYGSMPRSLRIISVYLLVLLIAGGIFVWRVAGLRSSRPNPGQWSFEFAETPGDWERYLQSGTTVDNNDQDTEAAVGLPEEDEDLADAVSGEPPAGAVFQPGKWPVDGDLLYGYGVVIQEDTSASTTFKFSKGVAIAAPAGTVVRAAWDGTVVKTNHIDAPYGQSVAIEHDFGLVTYYGALGGVRVEKGDAVTQGEIIGTVAVGSDREQSHLFLSIMEDGKYVDPEDKLLPR